jgi:uncharacterized protein (DUF58 family)
MNKRDDALSPPHSFSIPPPPPHPPPIFLSPRSFSLLLFFPLAPCLLADSLPAPLLLAASLPVPLILSSLLLSPLLLSIHPHSFSYQNSSATQQWLSLAVPGRRRGRKRIPSLSHLKKVMWRCDHVTTYVGFQSKLKFTFVSRLSSHRSDEL